MTASRIAVEHVCVTTSKPFADVVAAFERQLGRFNPEAARLAVASGDPQQARAKIDAMAGPSGFMVFATMDHGSLLALVGRPRQAVQYVVGNPVLAVQMTQHDLRAGLYAPLRVLLYENEAGQTCLEYDKPSTLFGQFGNEGITPTATLLDRKLEAIAAQALA
jgi:uncharacterized protein (DUF302 family)